MEHIIHYNSTINHLMCTNSLHSNFENSLEAFREYCRHNNRDAIRATIFTLENTTKYRKCFSEDVNLTKIAEEVEAEVNPTIF